jgi:hypothetical protein
MDMTVLILNLAPLMVASSKGYTKTGSMLIADHVDNDFKRRFYELK